VVVILFPACRVSSPDLYPLPEQVSGVEGYASLKLASEGRTTRSRFSFLFQFPETGRIEATDLFGKILFMMFIKKKTAYLVIPDKKLFCQGSEAEAVEMFFGFKIGAFDLLGLITGRWVGREISSGGQPHWEFSKEKNGRISEAEYGDLLFTVEDYFGRSSFVKNLSFTHPGTSGQIRILRIGFDPLVTEEAFSLGFLHSFQRVSWKELGEAISHEN
jgi:hypothetical protein